MAKMTDYEKKLLEMQYLLKENNTYMQDTFADLENWSKDMKEKETKLKDNPDIAKISNKGLPPIRSLATTKKKKKVKKPKDEAADSSKSTTGKTKKLNSYDYRAWDKLDVDKMCEEVDERKTSSSEYTTDEEWEEEQRKVKANWEKERGNQFFKDNMLNEAITCYTCAIDLDPSNAIYPANRAMCLLKQEKYGAAEVDCTLSIRIDPNYAKAYHRRATARTKLGKLEEAKKDYQEILRLEPNNKSAQADLNKLEQMIESRPLVFPINKTEEQKSKKPLKRIQIEEINDDSAEKIELEKNIDEINQKIKLNLKEEKLFEVNTSEQVKTNKIVELDAEPSKKDEEKCEKVKEEKVGEKLKQERVEDKNIMPTQTAQIKTKKIPDAPANGYQFKKDWQFLKDNLDDLALYFKKIPPTDYQKLFLNGLESDILSKILGIFKNYYINDPNQNLLANLKCLAQVKRFESQLMLLSSQDQKNIGDLFKHLDEIKADASEIENLKKIFKL